MTFLQSVFLGFVQGVAEFLPISSSGHLSLLQNFLGIEEVDMLFDVLLHLGTLVAVFVAYWNEIVDMIKEFFAMLKSFGKKTDKSKKMPPARRMIILIIVACLPLFAVLLYKDAVEELYYNTFFIGAALIVTGIILWLSEKLGHGSKNEKSASILDAFIVGCCQAVAVVPGLSRSGCTITGGLLRGFDRAFALRFSFILSIPAVLGANFLTLIDVIAEGGFDASVLPVYLAGVVSAMIFGYLSIRLLKYIAQNGKFSGFSFYCWVVGTATIILSVIC